MQTDKRGFSKNTINYQLFSSRTQSSRSHFFLFFFFFFLLLVKAQMSIFFDYFCYHKLWILSIMIFFCNQKPFPLYPVPPQPPSSVTLAPILGIAQKFQFFQAFSEILMFAHYFCYHKLWILSMMIFYVSKSLSPYTLSPLSPLAP